MKFRYSWILIIFLTTFYYIPLMATIQFTLLNELSRVPEVVRNPLFVRALFFTIYESVVTTLLCMLIGLPTGWSLARGNPYMKKLLSAMVLVPFLMPPMTILLGFVILFEKGGIFDNIFGYQPIEIFASPTGIIFAHVIYNISVVARISAIAFENESKDLHDIAETLGAGRFRRFMRLTLPNTLPQILSSLLLVFLLSFNSFAIPLMLGGVSYQTLEVLIYTRARIRFDLAFGTVIAILQLVLNSGVTILYLRLSKKTEHSTHSPIPPTSHTMYRVGATSWIALVVLLTWQPILITGFQMVRLLSNATAQEVQRITAASYDGILGTTPLRVIGNTLIFGIGTGAICVFLAGVIIYDQLRRGENLDESFITLLTVLPMTTSAITLSLGITIVFGRNEAYPNLVWVFVIIAQTLVALPFVIRTLTQAWDKTPKGLYDVAKTLGASEPRILKEIVIPLLKNAIVGAFMFGVAVSFGEFGATLFLSRGEWVTISLAIGKLFGTRSALLPTIYAFFLGAFTFVVFYFVENVAEVRI